jgi:multiple sugar transport system permease protein
MSTTLTAAARQSSGSAPLAGVRHRRRTRWVRNLTPWLFLLPALLAFAYFKFGPMLQGVYSSLFNVRVVGDDEWVGLDNFAAAITDADLHRAVWHTVLFVSVTVIVSLVIAFGIALILEGPALHLRLVRTAIFLPAVTAVAVVAEVWRLVYWPTGDGLLNSVLGWIGLGPSGFLSSPDTALASVMGMQIWKSVPYDMVIILAGLVGVNRELYEAAALDGTTVWQRIRHVTIPALRGVFTIVIVLGIIRGFRVFTEVYVLTAGGPAGSTDVVMTYIYRTGFDQLNLGYAAAVSTLLFVATAVLTAGYLWISRRREAA